MKKTNLKEGLKKLRIKIGKGKFDELYLLGRFYVRKFLRELSKKKKNGVNPGYLFKEVALSIEEAGILIEMGSEVKAIVIGGMLDAIEDVSDYKLTEDAVKLFTLIVGKESLPVIMEALDDDEVKVIDLGVVKIVTGSINRDGRIFDTEEEKLKEIEVKASWEELYGLLRANNLIEMEWERFKDEPMKYIKEMNFDGLKDEKDIYELLAELEKSS